MAKSIAVAVGGDCVAAYESCALAGPPVAYRACAYCAVVDDSILEKTNRSRESVNAASCVAGSCSVCRAGSGGSSDPPGHLFAACLEARQREWGSL